MKPYLTLIISLLPLSCYRSDVSVYTNNLQQYKSSSENLLRLLVENCHNNLSLQNEGIMMYIEVQAGQNVFINQLISDIRNSKRDFELGNELVNLNQSYQKFYYHVKNSISSGCRPKWTAKSPLELIGAVIEITPFLYDEITGKEFRKQLIQELENLKMSNYYDITER